MYVYIYISYIDLNLCIQNMGKSKRLCSIPVVRHKAVAELSESETYRRAWSL